MKKIRLVFVIALATLATSCAVIQGMLSLMTCKFNIQNINNPKIGSVSLANINDINDLNAIAIAQIAGGLITGNLPLSADINIGIQNPNTTVAQLTGFDWSLNFNDKSILTGASSKEIQVAPNGGTAIAPLTVAINVMDLFKRDERNEIFAFANSLLNLGDTNSKMQLKIRPSLSIGGRVVQMDYITLDKSQFIK